MDDIEFLQTDPLFEADLAKMRGDGDIEAVLIHPDFPKAMAAAMQRFQDQMDEWDGGQNEEAEGESDDEFGEVDMCPLDGLHDPNKCELDHTLEQVNAWKESKFVRGNPASRSTTSQVASSKVATSAPVSSQKCRNGDKCSFNEKGRCKFAH